MSIEVSTVLCVSYIIFIQRMLCQIYCQIYLWKWSIHRMSGFNSLHEWNSLAIRKQVLRQNRNHSSSTAATLSPCIILDPGGAWDYITPCFSRTSTNPSSPFIKPLPRMSSVSYWAPGSYRYNKTFYKIRINWKVYKNILSKFIVRLNKYLLLLLLLGFFIFSCPVLLDDKCRSPADDQFSSRLFIRKFE